MCWCCSGVTGRRKHVANTGGDGAKCSLELEHRRLETCQERGSRQVCVCVCVIETCQERGRRQVLPRAVSKNLQVDSWFRV
jgi:hypothetical protein